MELAGINIIDANTSQPIMCQEDHEAFLTIVAALGRPKSNLNLLCNQFHTEMPIDDQPMRSLPPMVWIQC